MGGNDFTLVVDGPAEYTGTNAGEEYELRRIDVGGGNSVLQLLVDNVIVDSRPYVDAVTPTEYTIYAQGGDDSLLVNFAASGGYFTTNVDFHGGDDDNTVAVDGGLFDQTTYTASDTDNDAALIVFSPAAPQVDMQVRIAEVGLTELRSFSWELELLLPNSADRGLLEDLSGGFSRLSSVDAVQTFSTIDFSNPDVAGLLQILTGGGSDLLSIASLDPTFAAVARDRRPIGHRHDRRQRRGDCHGRSDPGVGNDSTQSGQPEQHGRRPDAGGQRRPGWGSGNRGRGRPDRLLAVRRDVGHAWSATHRATATPAATWAARSSRTPGPWPTKRARA